MSFSGIGKDSFYEIGNDRDVIHYTDKMTQKPVSATEAFLQHRQGYSADNRCFIYAGNAMAGHQVVDPKRLVALSNKTLAQELGTDEDGLKLMGEHILDENDLDRGKNGISPIVAKRYIEAHKGDFGLSPKAEIMVCEGNCHSKEFRKAIAAIEKDPKQHRAILGVGAAHYVALRKDKAKKWRVIDSQDFSHDKTAKDRIKELQPSFSTLQEAIDHTAKARGRAVHGILIYPKEPGKSYSWTMIGMIAATSLALVGGALYFAGSKSPPSSPSK